MVASAVAIASGDLVDATAIVAVLILNAALGFTTELRARRAMEALRALESPGARVLRGGVTHDVAAATLVPGDVILLEAGRSVPADARLIAATELTTVEASLTGEALPVAKSGATVLDHSTLLADRTNLVFQGTSVVSGEGRAVVFATGDATEVGRIGVLTSTLGEELTPLERKLDVLGRRLVWVALAVAGLVAAMGLARGDSWADVLSLGIALAVAAVPEGLPAVATVALAVGVSRLARRRALVRRLPAVETLGAVTVVCTDKTGTLTAGEMTVTVIYAGGRTLDVTGTGYTPSGTLTIDGRAVTLHTLPPVREALAIGALANRAAVVHDGGVWRAIGDPTEAALIVAARKAGLDVRALHAERPEVGQIPFSSERKWMATFHRVENDVVAYVKGAPDRLIDRCTREVDLLGNDVPLDHAGRERLHAVSRAFAAQGLRTLAVTRGDVRHVEPERLDQLSLVALVGITDPPAAGVRETVALLQRAGIRTVMITGDHRLTATAIGRQLGLASLDTGSMDGNELAATRDDALAERLRDVAVVCRVSPGDKLRVVSALQRTGDIVAMLGDGVNDAAALRKADIGVAMGVRGTDIAKDAADIVLADDRFVTVGEAVEEGRVVFENIRKFVFYLFSCNLAEVAVLCVAGLVGVQSLLTPLQVLWLNLVTDTFPALALAVEPAERGLMQRPPRDPGKAILSATFMRGVGFYALLIAGVTLAAFVVVGDDARGRTAAFMTLALAQALHLGTARSRRSVLAPRDAVANTWALIALAGVVAVQALVVAVPALGFALDTVPLDARAWAVVVVSAAVPAVIGQAIRLTRRE